MRVFAVANFPKEAAATRFRVEQFVGPLRERGIELELSPFLSAEQFAEMYRPGGSLRKAAGIAGSLFRRAAEAGKVQDFDLLFVQREAMFFGPDFFEWLYGLVGRVPMVLDLDDATYVPYASPTYGKLGSALKFFGKTDRLIRRSAAVTCGNRFIAEYVSRLGTRAEVIPTVVDTEVFRPVEKQNQVPVIGWVGTHSTFPSLEWLLPVFERLSAKHQFVLRVVGSGRDGISISGVRTEILKWSLEREVEDFCTLDIGLYPIVVSRSASEEWLRGKSGFKAVQYLAAGVPFVMSPVGICAEIGRPGETHLNAESAEDWYNSLDKLLGDAKLRQKMGKSGREHSLANYTVEKQAEKLADVFRSAKNG
ncbi:MAG TPA: glycosyltransferase family 4 protein [Pyrinomonadaceae bacterium]|nr:glycosyltransferase family 4 protein [Pyrinomonadaceae bacterium]